METNSKIKLNNELIYIIGFSLYLAQAFLETTMLKKKIPALILLGMKFIGLVIVLVKIMNDKYSKKKLLMILAVFIISFSSSIKSTYVILFQYAILAIGAKDVSFKKIIKMYFKICVILLVITIILSQIGVIEDKVYHRGNGTERHSFGVVYPTDFAAHVFFLCLAYIYIKGKNIKWHGIIMMVASAIFTSYYCDARLDSLCIILAVLMTIFYKYNIIRFKNFIIKYILIFSFCICEVLSLYLTINYNASNQYYAKLNKILSLRLSIGNMMYEQHEIKLFGQRIDDHGNGSSLIFKYSIYNYIDCSYLRILLKYGLLVSIILTILNLIISKKFYENGNYEILCVMLLISINSMIAQHYIDFSYNFILLSYLAKVDENVKESVKENEKINTKESNLILL